MKHFPNFQTSIDYSFYQEVYPLSNNKTKVGSIATISADLFSISKDELTFGSLDFTLVSLDVKQNKNALLWHMGNASASLGVKKGAPKINAMVSLFSPAYSFGVNNRTITFTFHLGAYGGEFDLSEGLTIGGAKGIGLTVSIS